MGLSNFDICDTISELPPSIFEASVAVGAEGTNSGCFVLNDLKSDPI